LLGESGDNFVAGGSGTISNGSATIALKNLIVQNYTLSGDWTDDGPCGILLWNEVLPDGGFDESMGEPQYIYSSGTTISFENETTTVSWANFSSMSE
jgi:hypothetical protein